MKRSISQNFLPRHRKSVGLPPGTVVYAGDAEKRDIQIHRIFYNSDMFEESRVERDELSSRNPKNGTAWYDINGLWDTDLLKAVGEAFGLHSLVVEDIANLEQRPKVEVYDGYLFIMLRALEVVPGDDFDIEAEQICIVIGQDFVLTLQEHEGDAFDAVRTRLRKNSGRVRKLGADYLAYSLIDAIVDYYFVLLEKLGDEIDAIEEQIYQTPSEAVVRKLHRLKREIIDLRRVVWPMREVVNQLARDESALISDITKTFLRDLYDHIIQVVDTVEGFRDMATGLVDLSMSVASNRMNEVMKVLTIIATIFIPLTFIAGVYGMNFNTSSGPLSMPELNHPLGYAVVLGVMALVAIGMILFFKRKKWL